MSAIRKLLAITVVISAALTAMSIIREEFLGSKSEKPDECVEKTRTYLSIIQNLL